ncbi:MAG: hypothetical protein ACXW20_21750, partial [Burkholderiales bacterium]
GLPENIEEVGRRSDRAQGHRKREQRVSRQALLPQQRVGLRSDTRAKERRLRRETMVSFCS